ncbi:DUF6776 family protein [Teredinibacter sp. KSP-S5-2]|uniref:DUF6776 family protein n=1 Tax=Teredinibacter sp. KSP-S5-2 TaxID=3034506 RepID=UPI002934E163|nr:DUF6776 family protein [Teredinibacter sp. KSP-S5-2]WNO09604.1 hypothetical protein P5V12_00225 [Teredinibacter sp. KSP-S5-2]
MTAVKGSKHYTLKVVKDRPFLRFTLFAGVVLLFVLASLVAFQLGHIHGMDGQEKALADAAFYKQKMESAEAEVGQLQQEIANIHLGAEVDRQANEGVRKEVIALKESIAQLQEENSFYRNLMAPSGNRSGLTFGAVEITDTDTPRAYQLKVVMQQLAVNHNLLSGVLQVVIIGKQGELEAKYNFSDLSKDISAAKIRLRFKYFQNIEGKLILPEGFEPERIELIASTTGSKPVTIEKRFGWLVEEI